MAPVRHRGATFLLTLLSLASVSGADVDVDVGTLIARQEEHLNNLRELVDSLSGAVSRLESALSDAPRSRPTGTEAVSEHLGEDRVSGGEESGISVKRGIPLWLERFQLLAEARVEAEASCAAVLPYVDVEGIGKYVALGDVRGRVIIFSSAGDGLIESETPSGSPVTTMHAHMPARRNESILYTGHADGSVVGRKVWESGEDWLVPEVGTPHVLYRGAEGGDTSPVELLEVHQFGRMKYVVCVDGDGRIRMFMENGMLYGVALASSRPLAFMRQRKVFLTAKGVGWLDFKRMMVSERECEGLNGSMVKSYVFDPLERSKAYGITLEGNLIHVVMIGDGGNIKCRVRAVKKSEVDGDVSLLTIKGYLIAVNHAKVFMYNVASPYYSRIGSSRPVFSAALTELRSLFTNDNIEDGGAVTKPLIAGDRGRLMVLGLGGRHIGIYRPNFPVLKVQSNIVVWSSPALLFFMFLLGMWYLYVKKRGSMGLNADEPFLGPSDSIASGLLGSAGSDRPFPDAQRAGDLRDVRGSMLRGPMRRYAPSSSRYPGGGTSIPYMQSPGDSGIAGTAELKYRDNQAVEPAGFPLRRETIFTSTEALDDHVD